MLGGRLAAPPEESSQHGECKHDDRDDHEYCRNEHENENKHSDRLRGGTNPGQLTSEPTQLLPHEQEERKHETADDKHEPERNAAERNKQCLHDHDRQRKLVAVYVDETFPLRRALIDRARTGLRTLWRHTATLPSRRRQPSHTDVCEPLSSAGGSISVFEQPVHDRARPAHVSAKST